MPVTRREFLKWAGISAGAAAVLQACSYPRREIQMQSPSKLPEDLVKGSDNWYATQCRQCSDGCGIVVRVMEGRAKKVEGNLTYPINLGRHMARCDAGLQALYHPDRIKRPLKRVGPRGSGQFQETDWDSVLTDLVGRMKDLQSAGQADSLVIATDPLRGHMGLVANRFAQSYGATQVSYEPMDRVVLRKAMKQVFDQDRLPDFDIEHSNFILSFDANFLGTWVSPVRMGRGYGEFRQGQNRQRGYLVHVEPHMSQTAANADQWIPIAPGMEGALALSIAYVIISEGLGNAAAADALTGGRGAAALDAYAPEKIAPQLGIPKLRGKDPADKVREIARRFAQERPSLAIGGDSAAAHTNGLDNLAAIYSLNYLVGSVNARGGIVFNPPSAIDGVPESASGSSLSDWETLVQRLKTGNPKPVKLLIVRGIDPVYSLPSGVGLKESLDSTFVVSVSNFLDETALNADLVLPEQMNFETWADDIPDPAPGYQAFGLQQPIVNVQPGFDLRGNFGDMLLRFGQELGAKTRQALPWNTMEDVLKDQYQKLFQSGRGSVKTTSFDAFWTGVQRNGGWWDQSARSSAAAPRPKTLPKIATPEFAGAQGAGSYYLIPFANVGVGDGQHGHLPWLQGTPDPITTVTWSTWVEINLQLAESLGIRQGDILEISIDGRKLEAYAYPNPATPPNLLAVPFGQGHSDFGRYAKGRGFNVASILDIRKDAGTGALAWAANRATLAKTGKNLPMVRFEGIVLAVEPEKGAIIQVTRS